MKFTPCIRWCGGKRKQSEDIIARMPYEMDTFWIPFLGGGSVMYQLLNSNIKYKRVVASDIYKPLMDIWDMIQRDPQILLDEYTKQYARLQVDGEDYYYEMVEKFNDLPDDKKDPFIFHFITKSCMRGSIEFDKHGKFITKFQSSGDISSPESLAPIFSRWHDAIKDVEFRCESYIKILDQGVGKGDYCFFDPPYIDGTWYRDNNIDMQEFYEFLRLLPCDYSITLNGDRDIYPIPEDLYTKHEYIYYGVSKTPSGRPTGSRDSLWMRHNGDKYDARIKNIRETPRQTGGAIGMNTEFTMIAEINNRINIIEQKLDKIGNGIDTIMKTLKEGVNHEGNPTIGNTSE